MRILLLAILFGATSPAFGQSHDAWLIVGALEALGVSPDGPLIEDAVDEASAELLPGERYDRYRINHTQAQAIAYIEALFAASSAAPIPTRSIHPPALHLTCLETRK